MEFKVIQKAIQDKITNMATGELFTVDVSKDLMWDTYINSFPPETNKRFRTRTEHDCQCCKRFIRAAGNIVTFESGKIVSIWDVDIPGSENYGYRLVVEALSKLVKSKKISNVLMVDRNFKLAGSEPTRDSDKSLPKWNHFNFTFPEKFLVNGDAIGTNLSKIRAKYDVFKRGLEEINADAVDTVLDLISQDSLYKGSEYKDRVLEFKRYLRSFNSLTPELQEIYCWFTISVARDYLQPIRNTVIGTLLVDLSEGRTLEYAVGAFESKVAPQNYKRSSALITKYMIKLAHKKTAELGLESALPRRHATVEDITVNNIIFADKDSGIMQKEDLGVFGSIPESSSKPVNHKNLEKVEEVHIDKFISDVVPTATSIEIMFENEHEGNLVSLISPVNYDAKPILKWNNNFSWSYNGNVTDSIKTKVKRAGGDITGYIRCSLSWFNTDDLDLHVIEPDGNNIFYSNHFSARTGGKLDVDMNVNTPYKTDAVENITWPKKSQMLEGIYQIKVNNYTKRNDQNYGFEVEVECEGKISKFVSTLKLNYGRTYDVASFKLTQKNGIEIVDAAKKVEPKKDLWDISTGSFHKVDAIMYSPNHWDTNKIGNKHFFFILDGCNNPEPCRGLYNEFLMDDLHNHRKVFEHLGSELQVPESDNQLSGLGFSSTIRNHIYCKVTGSFTRTIKVIF